MNFNAFNFSAFLRKGPRSSPCCKSKHMKAFTADEYLLFECECGAVYAFFLGNNPGYNINGECRSDIFLGMDIIVRHASTPMFDPIAEMIERGEIVEYKPSYN